MGRTHTELDFMGATYYKDFAPRRVTEGIGGIEPLQFDAATASAAGF
jgi:hypothetical protein